MTATVPDVHALAVFLAGHPLCRSLTSTDIAEIIFALQVVSLPGDTAIVTEADPGDAFYVIFDGTVVIERGAHRVGRLSTGQFFGELAALDGQPRIATVRADGPVICLRFATHTVERLLASGSLAMHRLLVALLRELVGRVRPYLTGESAPGSTGALS